MTLGVRLIVLILLAAVPVFVVQVVHDFTLRANRIDGLLAQAETLAGLVTARQDRIVEGARLLLTATSYLQSIREKNARECSRRLRELAAQVPELTALAVLSPDGDRWCVSLPDPGSIYLADRKYFQETLRFGAMQTSDYIVGRQTGEGSVVFTYPARGETGAIESVIFVAYRASVMSQLLNEPPLPAGAFAALVDREGVIAARWPSPERAGEKLSSEIVSRAIVDRRGVLRGMAEWAGPGEYAFAFAPILSPSNLTVMVGLPLTAALREADTLFWQAVIWTTLIFLLAALVAIFGAHLMVAKPVHQLQVFADSLARGDFQSRPVLPVSGTMELHSLAKHFETMAGSLEQRQALLVESAAQKELLLKEVNHRVKNSLQLVASLLGLQRSRIKDPEARRQFDEAGRRINTVAQIHQRLYQDENVERVALNRFLEELCSDLNNMMDDEEKHLLVCNAAPCHLPTQQVIPVALIANELITNAFKYSYPAGAAGVIRVGCRQEGDNLVLSVSDDGPLLSLEFDPAKSSGLGMKMIVALAQQLRAKFEVVNDPAGKTFILRVPSESFE